MLNNLIFVDDFVELWIKIRQRGVKFILSKLSFLGKSRTLSSFTDHFTHANWWIIPYLRERQNLLITGDEKMDYEKFISERYFKPYSVKNIVSLGCGAGSHEIKLASLNPEIRVKGYDIAQKLITLGLKIAQEKSLPNLELSVGDVYKLNFEPESVDCFFFHSALHHFKDIHSFIADKVKPALRKGGFVIIHEYVGPNRLNLPKHQIEFCTNCLKEVILPENKKILLTNMTKTRCYRLGRLRMIVSDPSECVDSEQILPVLRRYFKELEFKNLGGNILVPTLKHIAHHYIEKNTDELRELIRREESYLSNHAPDFVFAVYQKYSQLDSIKSDYAD